MTDPKRKVPWQAMTAQTRQRRQAASDAAFQFTYHSGLDATARKVMRDFLKAVDQWQTELEDAEEQIRLAMGGNDVDPFEWLKHGKPVADSLLGRLMRPAGEVPPSRGR